jgi:hypothetical protein
MMEKSLSKYEVLSETKIRQKIAGYKSAWTKRIKAAKPSERKKVYAKSVVELARVEKDIREFNKKQIQRRAGAKSWITRSLKNGPVYKVVDNNVNTCQKHSCHNKNSKMTKDEFINKAKKEFMDKAKMVCQKHGSYKVMNTGHKITMCVKKNTSKKD